MNKLDYILIFIAALYIPCVMYSAIKSIIEFNKDRRTRKEIAISQIQYKQTLHIHEVLQLSECGVDMIGMFAYKLGVTRLCIVDLISQKQLTYDDVKEILDIKEE